VAVYGKPARRHWLKPRNKHRVALSPSDQAPAERRQREEGAVNVRY
jgi:hypothetical protein